MKILVVGFQRGGTTMVRRMIHFHPEISRCFHEKRLLKYGSKENIYNFVSSQNINPKSNWGDKVPFYTNNPSVMTDYCKKWLEIFEDSCVLCVTRHPVDIALSTTKLGWAKSNAEVIQKWSSFMPGAVNTMKSWNRVKIFSYEKLLTFQKMMFKEIYDFCRLTSSTEVIGNIINGGKKIWRYFDKPNVDRAYVYKKMDNLKINYNIPDYPILKEEYVDLGEVHKEDHKNWYNGLYGKSKDELPDDPNV